MTTAVLSRIIASLLLAIVTGVLVTVLGGPTWAALGFAAVTYFSTGVVRRFGS